MNKFLYTLKITSMMTLQIFESALVEIMHRNGKFDCIIINL